MRAALTDFSIQPLRQLPRDRKKLDFILNKLAASSSPERFELLRELFEMHRTSVGFDPAVLSKARFKRFKSFEIKKVLADLEQDLTLILNSEDYLSEAENSIPFKDLFDQYLAMVEIVTAPPSKELNEQVDNFCALLLKEGAHELLLSFYRHARKHFEGRNGRHDGVIERYTSLLSIIEFNSAYFLTGLQTLNLIKDDRSGTSLQEDLLLHLNSLDSLRQRSHDAVLKGELIVRSIRTAMLLHNRVIHLAPYIKELPLFHKYISVREKPEVLTIANIFNIEDSPEARINNLTSLEETSRENDQIASLIYIKLGKALLHADIGNYSEARTSLNEVEHLLFRNGFRNDVLRKAWTELHIYRLLLSVAEEISGNGTYDIHEFNGILQSIRDISRDSGYSNPLADGFKGIIEYIKGNKQNAHSCFEMMQPAYLSGTGNHLMLIISYFAELSTAKKSKKKLSAIEMQLKGLNEPFFSGSFLAAMRLLATK